MVNVSVVRDSDTERRVIKSIELLGGMGKFVDKGDIVLIKPNLVYPAPPPLTTDPAVVGVLVKLAKEAGAKKVLVGEGGAPVLKSNDGVTTKKTFKETGMQQVVEDNGGEIVCLDEESCEVVEVQEGVIYKKIKLYKDIVKSDKLIGVPVIKTHYDTDVSLGIKCWHGVIADAEKFWKFHRDDIHQKLVDLIKVLKPCLTVIDGTKAMEGLGPLGGESLDMNLVVASSDVVAADSVTATIMGFDPFDIDHIRIANMQGVGESNLEKINVLGSKIEEVKKNFKKPCNKITGVFKNVTVIEGGVCRACRSRTRWSLEQLDKLGKLDGEKLTVILGVDPYLPDPDEVEGKIIIVGDCACYFARSFLRLTSDKCLFVRGCPPIPVPKWVPSYHNVIH